MANIGVIATHPFFVKRVLLIDIKIIVIQIIIIIIMIRSSRGIGV